MDKWRTPTVVVANFWVVVVVVVSKSSEVKGSKYGHKNFTHRASKQEGKFQYSNAVFESDEKLLFFELPKFEPQSFQWVKLD